MILPKRNYRIPTATRFTLAFFMSFLIFHFAMAQVDHWEAVVIEGDTFQYLVPQSQPVPQWTALGFDDSSWATGVSGFGYGDGDDNTNVPSPSIAIYLRKEFSITDPSDITHFYLHMDYDDGFVAYLNGVEIARDLVSGTPPAFDQPADGLHEARLYRGELPETFEINLSLLNEGPNVLAVEVHNESLTSSDMTANPFLIAAINSIDRNYSATPSWFRPPVEVGFTSTTLPIVLIETSGNQTIPDDPKINASMKIINIGGGQSNSLEDATDPAALDYNGAIQIETRGSSSQALPKKSYGFTTYEGTEKQNISLLGMPDENDWILNSLAFDPSLLRDYFTYSLARALGEYASRGHYCEVFVNGEYQGLYVLQEKLKADNDRIDINRIEPTDNEGPELTGGYITKADKTTGGDPVAWTMPNSTGWTVDFIHEVPSPFEVTSAQNDYIKAQFQQLRVAAANENHSLVSGYPALIDIPSFVDFMLLNELASNPDAYQFSTYFHKDRNGKLRAGPIWDINLSYGNDLFLWGYDRSKTNIWQFELENSGATFWKDLYYDELFHCQLSKRWQSLREPGGPFGQTSLEQRLDETIAIFAEAVGREELAWGTIGDHANEIAEMKSWIRQRLAWMDGRLMVNPTCPTPDLPPLVISKIHYHPSSDAFDEDDLEFIEITNNGLAPVDLTGIYLGGTGLVYQFPAGASIPAGRAIMLANNAEVFASAYGIFPFGEFSRGLSNAGEDIELLDGWGNQIDLVEYNDQSPWPLSADGDGPYLELTNLDADNNEGSNWTTGEPGSIVSSARRDITVSVFPNPGQEYITIQNESIILELMLFDMQGKLLFRVNPNALSYSFEAKNLEEGAYLLIQTDRNGTSQHKVIIRR